jgi:hypothetical protein
MIRSTLFSAILLLMAASHATAQTTAARTLEALDRGHPAMDLYISGIGQGLTTMNALAPRSSESFCPPKGLAISGDQYRSILRLFVQKNPAYGKEWPAIALLAALQNVFPCN